jgi:hypothetical protein
VKHRGDAALLKTEIPHLTERLTGRYKHQWCMEKLVSDKRYENTSLHSIYGVQHIISKEIPSWGNGLNFRIWCSLMHIIKWG